MKILQVLSVGYDAGGVEIGVRELREISKVNNVDVRIVSSDLGKKQNKKIFSDYIFKNISEKPLFLSFFLNFINISAYKTIRKIISEYHPDIIHFRTVGEISVLGLLAAQGIPKVITVHGQEFYVDELFLWNFQSKDFVSSERSFSNLTLIGKFKYFYFFFLKEAYKLALKNYSSILTPSKFYVKLLRRQFPDIKYLPNGIRLFNYKELHNFSNILYVGRINPVKGVDILIKALYEVRKRNQKVTLTVIGRGPHEEYLKKLSCNLDLNVNFLGWVPHHKLQEEYEKTTFVVIPSLWPESFCKVGIEGMSVGRPIVASDVGAISEWLEDEKNGYLTKVGDVDDLVNKILQVISKDKKAITEMGKVGRIVAEKYSLENYFTSTLDLYKTILNK